MRNSFLVFILFCWSRALLGQGEVPVDMFTGTPSIGIPIWAITDHNLSETIGLVYSADGVKLEERNGVLGIGWNLIAGGEIVRELRGLPDDYMGTGSDSRKGWFYNSIASNIGNFSNSADQSSSTCTDETTDNTTLDNYNYTVDTEPDIFHYSAGGLSGSFVFDNELNIRLIPYRDIKIDYTTVSSTDKKITSFTITTNTGIQYTFDLHVQATRSTHKLVGTAEVEFLKREYQYYDHNILSPGLTYYSEWKLTKMESPAGSSITYSYMSEPTSSTSDTVRVAIRKLTSAEIVDKPIYYVKESRNRKTILSIISTTKEVAKFETQDGILKKIKIYDYKRSTSYVKEFQFALGSGLFLKSITEVSGCDKLPPYKFTYVGVDFVNLTNNLPSQYSKSKDFWGYYNGKPNTSIYPKIYIYPSESLSEQIRITPKGNHVGAEYILNGADRTPNSLSMQIGSLESITYPTGGSVTFNYEPHDYFDESANEAFFGGGLRIKSIIYFDGVNPQNKIVKSYEYKDQSGNSSGRLINRPVYSIPMREYRDPEGSTVKTYSQLNSNAQSMYEHLIVRTNKDLNEKFGEGSIGYGKVKVARQGSGSAEFEFSLPATYGSSSSGEWVPTVNKFARPSSCPSMELVTTSGAWTYPFSPNPNFSYERGFLLKKTEKNESGNTVREVTYSPQYILKSGGAPHKVYGVAYDFYPYSTSNIYFFGKYFLLTDVEKVTSTETVVTYDANDQNKFVATSAEYFYESPLHKLLTRTRSVGIDGTIVTGRLKYPLDYGTIPTNADAHLTAIKNLQTSFRNGTPVESTSSIQRPSEVEKVVGASLVKFSDFGTTGKVLPYQQLSLKIDQGVTDFTNSGQLLQGPTYILSHDSRYTISNTFLAFGDYDIPLSSQGNDRIPKSTAWGFRKSMPVVQAVNAKHNEFAFSDFETDTDSTATGNEFQHAIGSYSSGRTGDKSFPLSTFSKTLQKANVSNYKFSFWLKKVSAAVDINVKLKDVSNGTVYYNNTFNVNPAGSDFEYFEQTIPVTNVPSSFIIEFQGQNIPPGSYPTIDDVAFYPESADLISYTYDLPFGANSITDATASTMFVTYDGLGREKYVYDQDKNLIKKNSYRFASDQPVAFTASISVTNPINNSPLTVTDLDSFTFSGNETNCIPDGVTYEWDFGEGSGFQALGRVAQHTFITLGNVQVKLRKSHPYYGQVTEEKTVTVIQKNLTASICAKGVEWIQCGGATTYYSCNEITATPASGKTIFKAIGINVNETITSYSWQKSSDEFTTWSIVGTADTTPEIPSPATYQIRCYITTNTGRTGFSNILTVTKDYCN